MSICFVLQVYYFNKVGNQIVFSNVMIPIKNNEKKLPPDITALIRGKFNRLHIRSYFTLLASYAPNFKDPTVCIISFERTPTVGDRLMLMALDWNLRITYDKDPNYNHNDDHNNFPTVSRRR